MQQFNIHDTKTRFSKILAYVQAGEAVIVAKNGRPVAKIVPFGPRSRVARPLGTAKQIVRLSPKWNEPLPEKVLRFFES